MQRVAVFVDAGYLFAQGSAAVAGKKHPRSEVSLSPRSVIEELSAFALTRSPGCALLRIYWYDGAPEGTRMTADQAAIADLDDIKLRLGFINSLGQQKGVDALLVTDLMELARQRAITEALILSGDEDIRPGVIIAQNYGVRVYLLGLHPARSSQARSLRQECDTTAEWDGQTVAKFLSIREQLPASPVDEVLPADNEAEQAIPDGRLLRLEASAFVAALQVADVSTLQAYWDTGERGVPPEFDGRLLARMGARLGRPLTAEEKRDMRRLFRDLALARTQS